MNHKKILLLFILLISGITSCQNIASDREKEATIKESNKQNLPAVEIGTATLDILERPITYIGKTQGIKEVAIKARTEGRLLELRGNIGDKISQGQILGKIDNTLLKIALAQAESELAVSKAEVDLAIDRVEEAKVKKQQAIISQQQAQLDAERLSKLVKTGIISQQQAELAQTNAIIAQKDVLSAQEQIRIAQKVVKAAKERVKVQLTAIDREKERFAYSYLKSPISGIVTNRIIEPGNLVQPGNEVIQLGDFSQVKIITSVAQKNISLIKIGQPVTVNLDNITNPIKGKVINISPNANSDTGQIPLEIIIPNPDENISSGLLARVKFITEDKPKIVIPASAINEDDRVFLLDNDNKIVTRSVIVGKKNNNRVEILSGLNTGDRFIIKSNRPLNNGDSVRVSVVK